MKTTEKKDRIALRKERVQQLCEQLTADGYMQNDLTISADTANSSAMLTTILPITLYIVLFGLTAGWSTYKNLDTGLLMLLILLSLVVHEMIHGIFFGMFAPNHFAAIEFGVFWKSLNPYCYCGDPVSKAQYLIALLMPGFLLGTCTGAAAILLGDATLLIFSLAAYLCASGDFLVACKIFRFSVRGKEALFLDHPDQPGLLVFTRDAA